MTMTEKTRIRAAKPSQPRAPQTFKYDKPEVQNAGKGIVRLCQTDIIRGAVQVVKQGDGDNNLHSHTGMDGFWMVLKGRVRWYGPDDEILGEFGPHEGIVMPRNQKYWFQAIGDDDLEILQVVAFDRDVKNARVDVDTQKFDLGSAEYFQGRLT
jgi:mannose-6-phosphate isomerase-like protein (cupin superfamily)